MSVSSLWRIDNDTLANDLVHRLPVDVVELPPWELAQDIRQFEKIGSGFDKSSACDIDDSVRTMSEQPRGNVLRSRRPRASPRGQKRMESVHYLGRAIS